MHFTLAVPWRFLAELTKAKQTALLLYTALFAWLIASLTFGFNLLALAYMGVGIFLAVAGSTMLNMWWDRDIDFAMPRTRKRVLPSGKVHPTTVFVHGMAFTVLGIAVAYLANPLTALMVGLGVFFDVVVYSMWLKRRTHYSILFGGISGGLPAVAGYVAASGQLDWVAILLGGFVVAWVPLHILTLAMLPKNLDGYCQAGVPMWPVVRSQEQTCRVVAISAIVSAMFVVGAGWLLGLAWWALIPLLAVAAHMSRISIQNLRAPDNKLTFTIFKHASMFMAFAFLWLAIGAIFV